MNTKVRKRGAKSTLTTFWTAALLIMILAASPCALASTAENTTITNTVTVTYDDANNVAQDAVTATATVTVTLLPADPTISSPASIDPVTESTGVTLSYTVTGNANGDDDYTISTLITEVDLGNEASVLINGGTATITLGGTTLAADTGGGFTITVPYDGTDDGVINSIAPGDTIVIGLVAYQVAATGIDESSGDTTNTATITLVDGGQVAPAGSAGDVVGEQMQIDVVVTTGLLIGTATSGTHTVTATITSDTDGTASATQVPDTVITVRLTQLSVAKYVRDINNDPGGTADYTSPDGSNYYDSVNALPGATLEYIIVVTNDTGASLDATNVVIMDSIPQFTSYVSGSMELYRDIADLATYPLINLTDASGDDAGQTDGNPDPATIWINAGIGGTPGNGGTLAAGVTTLGRFQVTID